MIFKKKGQCIALTIACSLFTTASLVNAIQPETFLQSTEADFSKGENENTVVTNLGDIKLSASTTIIDKISDEASIIYDLQKIGDRTYLAAGPEAKLLELVGEEVKEISSLENEQIFSLALYKGKLLLGISGANSRLATLEDDGSIKTLVELSETRYIWDMIPNGHGIILATGIEGQIISVNPETFDAEAEENPGMQVVLDVEQANVLCLAMDSQSRIYAGTDTDGLVFRITPKDDGSYEAFVILDANEPEIGALLVTNQDIVYVGTADAKQAKPGRISEVIGQEKGRPDEIESVNVEPASPSDIPDVPPAPEPVDQTDTDIEPLEAPAETQADDSADLENAQEGVDTEPQAIMLAIQDQDDDLQPMQSDLAEQTEAEINTEPTAEQRDRLRELVRQKLLSARNSGTLQAPAGSPSEGGRKAAPSVARAKSSGKQGPQQGNAIYRIDKDGFVSQVFRESVMILKLIDDNGDLLVGTGNEGQIFRIDPSLGETTIVADLEAEQIPAMQVVDGSVLIGTANPAEIVNLTEAGKSVRGTYLSPILDAGQVSLWGTLRVTADIAEETSVTVETRSGNVDNPELAPWSTWSQAKVFMPLEENHSPLQPREMLVSSPPARYIQYRLTLMGQADKTPVIGRVATAYVTPNLRPSVTSVTATYPEPPKNQPQNINKLGQPNPNMNIKWEAFDPNGDTLLYTLQFQPSGTSRWINIVEDHAQPSFEWNTALRAPDGWYYIRIIATDKLDNPGDMALSYSRRSEPVLVDNSPPKAEDLQIKISGRSAVLFGTAIDKYSPIHTIGYLLDDEAFFHPILPDDLIFDSTTETFSVTLPDLTAGQHVVTVKVNDDRGNFVLQRKLFEIK
ncbi:hypothetical protein KS4_19340 [Poriferisphaera corsica]|uniref:Fibronectin type-III domain-containing protein n=1 Tax=Poriferisphaera corsica TaxID=2528020 RepID=A0A517YUF7_9BACT|nr:hypothetical protein [Poriferisphaera corsica]QDU33875.1 hypothetical protein KS4_19340 [Poriferisphaera corsica]